ncbi:MAG: hypothetical protein V4726_11015 [Verrucomicrobiota bacterium]
MRQPPNLKRMLAMLLRGQLIVSGGGLSIRQLTTGQIEISITPADARNNNTRAGLTSRGGDGSPGVPVNPHDPPEVPDAPPLPPRPDGGSGEYGGPTSKGRKIHGASSPDDSGSGLDYDFNQQGIEFYLRRF